MYRYIFVYINIGTSGAEIGGAFGGEKETGGGEGEWERCMEAVYEEIHMYSQLFPLPASCTRSRLRQGLAQVDMVSFFT